MSDDLISALKKCICFDEARLTANINYTEGFQFAAHDKIALIGQASALLAIANERSLQLARLQPVLLAMVEAIDGLESILHEGNLATQGNWDATNDMKQTAYGTLARLREAVEAGE